MRRELIALAIAGMSSSAFAEGWEFTPHIYARGGVTYDADFSRSTTTGKSGAWNAGPWNEESNLFATPLTEITIDAKYGDDFVFTYGVEVEDNNRNNNGTASSVNERLAYLTYYFGDHSLWFGTRPYRSEAEFLTRAFNFDNNNLYGGGVRFEKIGPVNVEFAYGSREATNDGGGFNEHTNFIINKVEYPLANGRILSAVEIQQHHRTDIDPNNDPDTADRSDGYTVGVSYQRWGDVVFGGNLYNQFLVHYGKGYLTQTSMGTAFSTFDKDNAASKITLQWNGDWKAQKYGVYWAAIYQSHQGKDSTGTLEDSDLQWQFADLIVRPQYGVLPNVTVGAEYLRRSVLKKEMPFLKHGRQTLA